MVRVKFKFENKEKEDQVVEGHFKDESILDIAEDADIHLNHNCGAVCACSTCHVYIEEGEDHLIKSYQQDVASARHRFSGGSAGQPAPPTPSQQK